jgi:hypothetical protein
VVQPGQIRQHTLLRTTAVYLVVAVDGDLVQLEVVSAPGLDRGDRYWFTRLAVAAMPVAEGVRPSGWRGSEGDLSHS